MRTSIFLTHGWGYSMLLLSGAVASAQPPPTAEPPSATLPFAERAPMSAVAPAPETTMYDWAVAGGLSFGNPVSGLGGLVGFIPQGVIVVERRALGPLWILARLQAGYAASGEGSEEGFGGEQRTSSGNINASLGMRFVFTPDDAFRFSTYLLLGGGYQRNRIKFTDLDGDSTLQSGVAAANLGFTLEHGLTSRLYLAISTDVASASYGVVHQDSVVDGVEQDGERTDGWLVGFSFVPALTLRAYF